MFPKKETSSEHHQLIAGEEGRVEVHLIGRIDRQCAGRLVRQLLFDLSSREVVTIVLDLKQVTYFDDFGALVLFEIRRLAEKEKKSLDIVHLPPKAEAILALANFGDAQHCFPLSSKKTPNLIVRLGEAFVNVTSDIRYLIAFLGSLLLTTGQLLRHPGKLRLGDTIWLMQKIGVDAVPIVGLISFLLGLIMAFVSSLQLKQFGASIFVASLVALVMVSELGPIMTAIVVAGRSGSAFAAELGTMRISDEIDALFTMGMSPTLFLVMPRLIAAVIVVPMLTLFANVFAITGGMTISVLLFDLTVSTYITQTIKALTLFELVWGLFKSFIFAALITWVGCLKGFMVRGGAQGVGNAATSAVVSSIFLIILFDSIFAVIRSYW